MTSEALTFAGLVFVALIIIGGIGIAFKMVAAEKNRKLDLEANGKYKRWLASVRANGGTLPIIRGLPIHLTKGEEGYFCDTSAVLYEPRSVRTGNVGGASFRVAKGVTIHSGGFSSESHDEWRETSRGTLYVTNKRIIFDGEMKNRVIPIADVMSVSAGYRNAVVNSHKLQRPVAFDSINGQIFAGVVNALAG